jgi:hypothetical protein
VSPYIIVNGVRLTTKDAAKRVKVIYNLARECAGEFYDMERSEKFRTNWPDQDEFVKSEWKSFVAQARLMLTKVLHGAEMTPENDEIHQALVIEREISKGIESDSRLQIMKDSQQFVGDKFENRKILEKFGKAPNMRAYLRRSTAVLQ